MPIPILAALALQAAGAGLSAYSANRANKKNREAMDAAARRVGQFQVNPLGNKLAQAYSESKLAENDLNQYQKQEAQDLLRAQGDVNYNLSNIAPSGFAALGAQSFNESKTQDQLGRLGAKYAPMGMAAKQQTNQLFNILICEINPILYEGNLKPNIDNIKTEGGKSGKRSTLTITVPLDHSEDTYQLDRRGGWGHDPGSSKMANKCSEIKSKGGKCFGPVKNITQARFGKITEYFITYTI